MEEWLAETRCYRNQNMFAENNIYFEGLVYFAYAEKNKKLEQFWANCIIPNNNKHHSSLAGLTVNDNKTDFGMLTGSDFITASMEPNGQRNNGRNRKTGVHGSGLRR